MIDKNFRESDLSIAKKIAFNYINKPVIDHDGTGKNVTKITSILVLNKEHSVYVNTPIEAIQAYADKIKCPITVVMENGKVLEENLSVKAEVEEVEEIEETEGKKKNKKK